MQETTEKIPESKVCESCGESFTCGARLDGCWCTKVTISPDIAADLKIGFNDCLCPKCLDVYASNIEH